MTRLLVVTALFAVACGPAKRDLNGDDDPIVDAKPPDAPCPTAVTGKVFAPNGTLPLYNVMVYVPETPPGPLPEGVQCSTCQTTPPGGAIAKTTTDATGAFRLEGVPPGTDVPIVIMTGKWRRQLTIPNVGQCVDNPVQDGVLRLPRNRSEGDIPRIAVVTGGCDPLACILSKLGLDSTEFGSDPSGPTRVVFYNGHGGSAPGTPQPASALWENLQTMLTYDMIINSCECSEYQNEKTTPDLLRQYADMGGRVFGSHFHYTWSRTLIPEWQGTASWVNTPGSTPDLVDTSHPDGMALAQWLVTTGASTTLGQISLGNKTNNAGPVNPPTTKWLHSSSPTGSTHYLSFQTPVGAMPAQQCGKVVFAGMHVSSGSVGTTFPAACNSTFSPSEKALVFLLFDLASCVEIIL